MDTGIIIAICGVCWLLAMVAVLAIARSAAVADETVDKWLDEVRREHEGKCQSCSTANKHKLEK